MALDPASMDDRRILIVEDDASFGTAVLGTLKNRKYQVMLASKVGEAVAKLKNQKFDCILLDMHLETASGESIINNLRSSKKDINHETPIIVMSGFLEPEVIKRIVRHVQGMLVKPFKPDVLIDKMETILKR